VKKIFSILLALVLVVSLGLVTGMPAEAAVSQPAVTVSPVRTGEVAEYTIVFDITSSLAAGVDSVTVDFPSDTTVPVTGIYSTGDIRINGANVSSGDITVDGRKVSMVTPITIVAPATVTVVFTTDAGIINPTITGDYTLWVNTSRSADQTPVVSAEYAIREVPTVTAVSPAKGNVGSTMWVVITGTSFMGDENTNVSDTTISFGAGADVLQTKYISVTEINVQIEVVNEGTFTVRAETPAGNSTTNGSFTANIADTPQVVTETVTGGGIVDAIDEADTEVVVSGTATVTVFAYDENPGGPPPTGFITMGKYIDVYVPDTLEVTEIEIRLYYTDAELTAVGIDDESLLQLLWWDGTVWRQCSDRGVNATNRYIWAKIRTDTTPNLTQLTGTPFGGMGKVTPTVTTQAATDISSYSGSVHMSYTVGTFNPVEVRFACKRSTDPAWFYTPWVSRTADGNYTEVLTGLVSETEYVFKAQLKYNGTVIEGATCRFTTAPGPGFEEVTETVTNGTVDARDEADTEVEVDGTATVTVAQYPDDPHPETPPLIPPGPYVPRFVTLGKYIDVQVPDTREATKFVIKLYYADYEVDALNISEESLRLLWWDGWWKECSDSGVNTASNYIWAIITEDTWPSLADLQGTPFGGYGHPTEVDICGCFIATAAYGTDTAKELDILREFRDTFLLPNSLGAEFVSLYYKISPPIANFISQHEVLRTAVRVGFVDPIVKILNWTHDLWSARG